MLYVDIAGTDLRVSRMAFGTASIHHLVRRRERLRLLDTAFSAGITHFDTSPYYGLGLAEADLGMFARERRTDVTLATKVGLYGRGRRATSGLEVWIRKAAGRIFRGANEPRVDWSARAAKSSLDASLRRLRTDYVDVLFLHEPDYAAVDADGLFEWLQAERSAGRVRYWGLAGDAAILEPWLAIGHPLGVVLQTKDSLADREADVLRRHGRAFQFTYGYLAAGSSAGFTTDGPGHLRLALERNQEGAVLFSSRRAERVMSLAATCR